MRTFCRLGVALVILIGAAGCGRKYYPVSGEVVFKDGTPLPGGWVFFQSEDPAVKTSSQAEIQPDGKFQLMTEAKGDGAPEGRYRVAVKPPLAAKREGKNLPPPLIDPRYENADTSNLEFTITRDPARNVFRIEVDRPVAGPKK
jgi:hypothetical protein